MVEEHAKAQDTPRRSWALGAKDARARWAGATMAEWVAHVVDVRERMRMRDTATERSRLRVHIEHDALGAVRVVDVSAGDVRAWLVRMLSKRAAGHGSAKRPRALSAKVVHNSLVLVRRALAHAVHVGLVDGNAARDVEVPRAAKVRTRADFEGVLSPDEQARLVRSLRGASIECLVLVALGLGLRRGELFSLEWGDVDVESESPRAMVRYGATGGRATKGGKPRLLPLFGLALDGLCHAKVRAAGGYPEPGALVFPARHGGAHKKAPRAAFRAALKRAGLRAIRWHDLRHTCATSLVMGWWGRRWTLAEVQAFLGHADQGTTERYVHVRAELLFAAARGTGAPVFSGDAPGTLQTEAFDGGLRRTGAPGQVPERDTGLETVSVTPKTLRSAAPTTKRESSHANDQCPSTPRVRRPRFY